MSLFLVNICIAIVIRRLNEEVSVSNSGYGDVQTPSQPSRRAFTRHSLPNSKCQRDPCLLIALHFLQNVFPPLASFS